MFRDKDQMLVECIAELHTLVREAAAGKKDKVRRRYGELETFEARENGSE